MNNHGGYRPNSGRKKGSKTIMRSYIVELGEEFDTIVGNSFKEVIDVVKHLALESEDDNIRLKAATYLINRILGMPTERVDQTIETIEDEEIAHAKSLLQLQVRNE